MNIIDAWKWKSHNLIEQAEIMKFIESAWTDEISESFQTK